jgi:hypothetical protein
MQFWAFYCFSFIFYYTLRAMGNREMAGIMKIACYAIMIALGVKLLAGGIAATKQQLQPLADALKSLADAINFIKGGPKVWLH